MNDTLSGEYCIPNFILGIIFGLLYLFAFTIFEKRRKDKHDRKTKMD